MKTKYIFVTGGVVSSLGKGITASSIGQILKTRGLKVFMQKFDPYINVDPGTMSPYQHGEVYVTNDGAETDLDLGHYERFIDENLTKDSSVTTGKIYQEVINNERLGKYRGATVQVIPHITDAIKDKLINAGINSGADVVITEIGGTVGDIESLPYLEAIRQFRRDIGFHNTLYIHHTLVPYLKAANEIKTKPTQHSVKELRSLGIQPDIIVLRSDVKISKEVKEKIALFCDVSSNAVFESLDVEVLYQSIINLNKQQIDNYIIDHFKLGTYPAADLSPWVKLIRKINGLKNSVKIGLVGKYVSLQDAYISVNEALKHAGYSHNVQIDLKWINAEKVNDSNVDDELKDCEGILIPGGFGKRATEGKKIAIKYGRENNIPTFGICYGMQLMVVEYVQNVLGFKDANTTEIDTKTNTPLFITTDVLENLGGTLRLGLHDIKITNQDSISYEAYQNDTIFERHRHRYDFNNKYANLLNKADLNIVATHLELGFAEIVELSNHPWFLGVQYHPEFISRPLKPHPLFMSFIKACLK